MPPHMPADASLSPALKKLQRKIAELKKKDYLPEAMVGVISEVALLQCEAEGRVRFDDGEYAAHAQTNPTQAGPAQAGQANAPALPPLVLDALTPADMHAQGAFLCARKNFPVDTALTRELIPAVLRVISEQAPELTPLADAVRAGFASGEYDVADACRAALAGAEADGASPAPDSCFAVWENKHPEAPGFFRFVIQSALMPSIVTAARLIGEKHPAGTWHHGFCPVCGSLPLMGRLMDNEGIRMHACSFCGFEFRAPRIGCPFCLTEPEGTTDYCSSEDEPGYQFEICKTCRNYIKIADFRAFDRVYLPMLDDLASLTLDIYARSMGYTRPTLSAWGF